MAAQAEAELRMAAGPGARSVNRFEITAEIRVLGAPVKAVPVLDLVPSLSTFLRAVRRA